MSEPETEPDFEPAPRTSEAMLRVQLAEAKAILRKLEWLDGTGGYQRCPECEGIEPATEIKGCGHAPDCPLAALIGGGT